MTNSPIKLNYDPDRELSLLHVYAANRLARKNIRVDTFMCDPGAVLWAVLNNATRLRNPLQPGEEYLPLLPRQRDIEQHIWNGQRKRGCPTLRKLCAQWWRRQRQLYRLGCQMHDKADSVVYFMMADEAENHIEDLKACLETA